MAVGCILFSPVIRSQNLGTDMNVYEIAKKSVALGSLPGEQGDKSWVHWGGLRGGTSQLHQRLSFQGRQWRQ